MTDRQTYDFEKYQYGALAAKLASSDESARFAPGALEVLAGAKGLGLSEEALEFHRAFGEQSEEQVQSAIRAYAGSFEEKRGKYLPSQLAGWYDSVIGDLDDNAKEKILGELAKHGEPLKTITLAYAKAAHALKTPGGLSPEDEAKARETARKYENTILLIQVLDSYKFEELRGDAVAPTRKTQLKNLASKL